MIQFLKGVWNRIRSTVSSVKEKIVLRHQLKDHYRDLAPIDKISNGKEYLKALHWAIRNKRVKNIALTGPYGSGKSSIINSYLKRHPIIKAKHLRISMATFIENATGDDGQNKKITVEPDLIQEGILKQLFYKVNHRRIPQSRYRKLYKVSFWSVWLILLLLVVAIAFFAFVFTPEQFDNIVNLVIDAGAKFEITETNAIYAFCGAMLLAITVLALIWRQLYSRLRINEIKVKDTTISPDKKENESIFNKNMDEIVYFFEETKYRVVFFEDLDRLDSSRIFVQLRELNTLLNNSDTIKRPIVFVYAVKDDIFTEEDRTKFFEFIIPVIPVINSTNSGEIMLDLFKVNGSESFKHDISLDYILDISPYISDMRVLQNIHNEFLLYKRTLRTGQGLELSDKMMLSLIIFKNIYPKDFADLQMEGGIVKQAFKDKQEYIQKKQKELQNDIDASVDVIASVTSDTIKSTKEIKVAMLSALVNWDGTVTTVGRSWGPDYSAQDILSESFDMSSLCTGEHWYVSYRRWGSSNNSRTAISNFTEICSRYYERYKYLHTYEERQLTTLQQEVEYKKEMKYELSRWSLQELIEQEGDEAIFSDSVKDNNLLVFMLRKGYIDEKYVSYVNYFKGSSITTDDMNYILGIKNREAKPFDYTLSKVAQVVHRLLPHEFEQREALNFTVLAYLLASTECDAKLHAMMKQLSDGSEPSWKFIDEFVMQTSQISRFIQLLSQSWDTMWEHIYHDPVLTYDRKVSYLSLLCTNTGVDTLLKLNGKDRVLSRFFEEHDDILQKLSGVETEKMVSIIPALNISFSKLKIDGVDSEVLACIFDNRFYAINPEMIHNVVAYKDSALCNDLATKNYTAITALGYSPLLDYIHDNLPFYIDNIVLAGNNRKENISQIIDLIRRSIADVERCTKIIRFEEFCLSNISACCTDLYSEHQAELESIWDALLSYSKIEPTWENVDRYWSHFGFTNALSEYVKTNADSLVSKSSSSMDDDIRREIIQSDIQPPAFTKLLKHLSLPDFSIPLANIHEVNIKEMIKEHYFSFSAERYEELSECYPALCAMFILENKNVFLSEASGISLKQEVFESIVLSAQAGTAFIESILRIYGSSLMSKAVAEQICSLHLSVPITVFNAAWEVLDVSQKKTLMIDHLDILQAKDFEFCFNSLGTPYKELADRSRRHNVTLPKTEDHEKLAKRLLQIDYITSYEHSGIIKVYSRTLRKEVDQPAILYRVKVDNSNKDGGKK